MLWESGKKLFKKCLDIFPLVMYNLLLQGSVFEIIVPL